MPTTYRVVYEQDEDGEWIARVPSVPGCHTHGSSIDQTRERIREALGLFVDDADTATLEDVVPGESALHDELDGLGRPTRAPLFSAVAIDTAPSVD